VLFEQYLAAAMAVSHSKKTGKELMFLPVFVVFGAMATALTFFSAFFKPLPQHLCLLSCRDLADPPLPLWFLPSHGETPTV